MVENEKVGSVIGGSKEKKSPERSFGHEIQKGGNGGFQQKKGQGLYQEI